MMTDEHDPKNTSDFPGEDISPPRRRSESQAIIRLQRESVDSISDIDGPEVEPLSPLTTMAKKRARAWLPWVLILLGLLAGLLLWFGRVFHSPPAGPVPNPPPPSETPKNGE